MIVAVVVAGAALLAALLVADRVAVAYVQGRIAANVGNRGFSARPQVTIAGFPFLTQLAARRLNRVVISAAGKKLGLLEVKRLDLTLYGVQASPSYKISAAARLSGTALVGLARPGGAGGLPVAAFGLLRNVALSLPALPRAMTIHNVSVTSQGVHLYLAGHDVSFG